jgi:hypothetical protein
LNDYLSAYKVAPRVFKIANVTLLTNDEDPTLLLEEIKPVLTLQFIGSIEVISFDLTILR